MFTGLVKFGSSEEKFCDDDFLVNHLGRICVVNQIDIRSLFIMKEIYVDDDAIIYTKSGQAEKYMNRIGEYHREGDNAAIIWHNGSKQWFKNGKLHRENGPAHIHADGLQEWYYNGRQHREDGPAVIYKDGSEEWYQHGKLHRDNGPASIDIDGYQGWWYKGKRHRIDGPAVYRPNYPENYNEWWIDDISITSEVQIWIEENNLPNWKQWDDAIWIMFKLKFI